MKQLIKLFIILIYFSLSPVHSSENFFREAKKLYNEKKYEESKFLFQRNIVFNPKDVESYLYLAKIFKVEENNKELEKYLETTLLLESSNEEAMYMLIDRELEKSNFSKVKNLTNDFKVICSSLCDKISSIEEKLENFDES
tara:strand:- start:204 stop:626 length:423 start_codon:yes stop_codon:yes gene_type:complete